MMEILAENRFTITKSLFYEGMLRVFAENYGKFAKKAAVFLALAWVILAAVTLWQQQNIAFVGLELVVSILAMVWVTVILPRHKTRRAFQAMQNRGGDLERVTRFYRDRLEVDAGGNQTVVPYSEITQVLSTEQLMILMNAENTGVLVKLDGFLNGSDAMVRELIAAAKEKQAASDSIPSESSDRTPDSTETSV